MRRILGAVGAALLLTGILVGAVAAPADAHILPTTTVALDVHASTIGATLRIPVSDLELAAGIELADDATTLSDSAAASIRSYIAAHMTVTSTSGDWSTDVGALSLGSTKQFGTATFPILTAAVVLTSSSSSVPRTFSLHYDVVLDRVVTHTAIVSVRSDWSSGQVETAREIGIISEDTVTNTVPAMAVDLGDGNAWKGFIGMVQLGIAHIREGTDHQLFLLTLLLPAPLLVARRRWTGAAPPKGAIKRIATITLAFTLGHSLTLALGALGLPVPQQAIEALIAVSILVAAAHAIRPIFPGREALIAAGFGLIHGMAFSATLTQLDLSGGQLALSLLGFNLGIELMQLAIVALVLPPLCVLARTRAYRAVRVIAAGLTAVAAAGWLLARLGLTNPVATVADGLADTGIWLVAGLWIAAATILWRSRRGAAMSVTAYTVAGN